MAPMSLTHLLVLMDVGRVRIIVPAELDFDMIADFELIKPERTVFAAGLGLAFVPLVGVRRGGLAGSVDDLRAR